METVHKKKLPTCDLCEKEAHYDTKTTMGSFANLCEKHYKQIGREPTTKLEETPDNSDVESDEIKKVKIPIQKAATQSVINVECPHCGHPRRVESDANYTVECESCNNKFKVIAPM